MQCLNSVNSKILKRRFYKEDTKSVAKNLIGKTLYRKTSKNIFSGFITETEAYIGQDDSACHTKNGRTERNSVMFGVAGKCYIYLIYGIYNMLNIVTEKVGNGCAVLIRGVLVNGINIDGPGKVCREFQIDRSLYGKDVTKKDSLIWIENNKTYWKYDKLKRVGIDYAKIKDRNALLRFKALF